MVTAVAETIDVDVHVIPFPVNQPELWHAYVPANVTQYIRRFSDWGTTKIDRFRSAGYDVVILDEGVEKEISGADVRAAMREGSEWRALVPAGVARVIEQVDRTPALTSYS
jgi:nicotinamide mononucleotide adenylyltransferase